MPPRFGGNLTVITYRSFVGLDVHARTIVGCMLDELTRRNSQACQGARRRFLELMKMRHCRLRGALSAVFAPGTTRSVRSRDWWEFRGDVKRALEADRPLTYRRQPADSSFDAFAPRVRELLAKTPTTSATVLADRVGWTGTASLLSR